VHLVKRLPLAKIRRLQGLAQAAVGLHHRERAGVLVGFAVQ
jgi:hypothetical protein